VPPPSTSEQVFSGVRQQSLGFGGQSDESQSSAFSQTEPDSITGYAQALLGKKKAEKTKNVRKRKIFLFIEKTASNYLAKSVLFLPFCLPESKRNYNLLKG